MSHDLVVPSSWKADALELLDAAVVGIPDERWGESVVAIVVPRLGSTLNARALDEHARRTLAGHKRPKHYLLVTELPVTKA